MNYFMRYIGRLLIKTLIPKNKLLRIIYLFLLFVLIFKFTFIFKEVFKWVIHLLEVL